MCSKSFTFLGSYDIATEQTGQCHGTEKRAPASEFTCVSVAELTATQMAPLPSRVRGVLPPGAWERVPCRGSYSSEDTRAVSQVLTEGARAHSPTPPPPAGP